MAALHQLSTHGQKFDFGGCYSTKPLACKILRRTSKKCPIYPRSKICAPPPENVGHVHQNFFKGLLLHKTPNHPKFHQNRLKNTRDVHNQKFVLPKKWASDMFFGHGQKRDYLGRASSQQHARGATNNAVVWQIHTVCTQKFSENNHSNLQQNL